MLFFVLLLIFDFVYDMTLEKYKKYCYEWISKNYCCEPVPDCHSCIADYYCDATGRNCMEIEISEPSEDNINAAK